jgi:diguanylate cyclase
MADTTDWKEKFRLLAEKMDADSAAHEEKEKLLCRTIIRLTLATSGLDSSLDPHLKKLRDAVRKGVSPSIQRHISELSETLIRNHEDAEAQQEETKAPDLFQRLLGRASLPSKQAGRLLKLGKKLVANPAEASDGELDEVIELLSARDAVGSDERARAEGLLSRLFGRGREEREPQGALEVSEDPNQLLLKLLESLNWPGQLSQDIAALGGRLSKGTDPDAWVVVIKELTEIVSNVLGEMQSEIAETEHFLTDLTARLQELDQSVQLGQSLREASRESGRNLNQTVRDEVGGIERSVERARDLSQLKQDIARRLDTIREHVNIHLTEEESRFQQAEESEKALLGRLKVLEEESESLHRKINEEQRRSLRDAVTGLPNRMAYEQRMVEEHARWKRFDTPLVLAVWDLDDFKQINDRFGHQAGDKALGVIGNLLRKRLRETDFVARYGGEEFAMVFFGSHLDECKKVVEEIRRGVERSGFHSGTKRVKLTISCGISEFRRGDDPDKVFARADKALYKAKRAGKNCCMYG